MRSLRGIDRRSDRDQEPKPETHNVIFRTVPGLARTYGVDPELLWISLGDDDLSELPTHYTVGNIFMVSAEEAEDWIEGLIERQEA